MAARPSGILTWNLKALAQLLMVSEDDVREYFTDGRRISFLIERRLARGTFGGKLASSEGAAFDFEDATGRKWEVRSISPTRTYFCPSYMVGSGRSFEEEGFLQKIGQISGYILADISGFPNVPFWVVPSSTVLEWWKSGQLGAGTTISRMKLLLLLEGWHPGEFSPPTFRELKVADDPASFGGT